MGLPAHNHVQFKWSEPEETGGRPVQLYVLEMTPPPMGWESPPSSGGWYQMYSGMEKNWLVKRLQPGVQYTARVKVNAWLAMWGCAVATLALISTTGHHGVHWQRHRLIDHAGCAMC